MYVYNIFKAGILIAFSYVIYLKISGWTASFFMKFITGTAYVIVFSVFTWKLSTSINEPFKSLFTILLSAVFLMTVTKEVFHPVIVNTAISYAASYVLFLLASIAAVIIIVSFYWINGVAGEALLKDIIEKVIWETTLLALIIELIITMIFIRFNKIIPTLQEKLTDRVGISISGMVIVLYSLSRYETLSNRGLVLFVSGIAFCAAGLIYWFKNETIIAYNERVRKRMEERLKTELKELQDINDYLETAAHRDAKRLPAYRRAVEELISSIPDEGEKDKAIGMLKELTTAEQEQSHEVCNKLRKGKKLPPTGMVLLDNVFAHMLDRAAKKDIDFDLIIDDNINSINDIIIQTKLETLAADLIENAITATELSDVKYKSILIYLWIPHGVYELRIDDNGMPFDADILIQLGKHRITTHTDTGGSGIGFMTVFDTLYLYGASLIIIERPPMEYQYLKSVVVRFDGKKQKIICSYRVEDLTVLKDESWIIEDFSKTPWD